MNLKNVCVMKLDQEDFVCDHCDTNTKHRDCIFKNKNAAGLKKESDELKGNLLKRMYYMIGVLVLLILFLFIVAISYYFGVDRVKLAEVISLLAFNGLFVSAIGCVFNPLLADVKNKIGVATGKHIELNEKAYGKKIDDLMDEYEGLSGKITLQIFLSTCIFNASFLFWYFQVFMWVFGIIVLIVILCIILFLMYFKEIKGISQIKKNMGVIEDES